MPPKKREKVRDSSKNASVDQLKSDHELFLQAFEKPTQIYRFLGSRQLVSPVFLPRSLTYMRQRMSRNNKNRKNFKVDSLYQKVLSKQNLLLSERPSGNLTLKFIGYYDKNLKVSSDYISIEATLLKICHKKRKEASSPIMQTPVGKCDVQCNPDLNPSSSKLTAITIPSDSFNLSNGHLVKSYVLVLRASHHIFGKNRPNGILCNGESNNDAEEPPSKKRKTAKGQTEETRFYGAELVVFDKHQRCLLTDGEYQLAFQECGQKSSPRKTSSWETFPEANENALGLFDVFSKGPLVTLQLSWGTEPVNGLTESSSAKSNQNLQNGLENCSSDDKAQATEKPKKTRIFYQFLYNNNTRQQTEAREDFHCPWCKVNCLQLYCLLKHLKLCHGRFAFSYVPHAKGARIDVSINESYDGSYVGNPHDLHCQTGFAFSRSGPVRRNPVTHVMVCRPKRYPPSLSEFLENEESGEADGPRTYISGHNRVYYHSGTSHIVRPQEIDVDSEGENDPGWLRTKTQHMIDEFTDVNEGEKELMKMWNLHIMKHGFVGDCQIPLACSMFIEEHGRKIIQSCLYHNFLLHLCNLFDFGLISASVVYHTMRQLIQLRDEIGKSHNPSATTSQPGPSSSAQPGPSTAS